MEMFPETSGTAALAGRDLPPAGALAADKHLTALAQAMKAAGQPGTLDILRAWAYLHLLSGKPAATLIPATGTPGDGTPATDAPVRGTSGEGTPSDGKPGATARTPSQHRPARSSQRSRRRHALPRGIWCRALRALPAPPAAPSRPSFAARST